MWDTYLESFWSILELPWAPLASLRVPLGLHLGASGPEYDSGEKVGSVVAIFFETPFNVAAQSLFSLSEKSHKPYW